jgi:hypothetical protein
MTEISQNLPHKLIPCKGVLPLDADKEAALRAALIEEARSWIWTPYRQLGATKGVAVDCSMLLVCCVINARIIEAFDPRPYPPAWFLHQEDERYIDWLGLVAVEVQEPKAGDFAAFKIGRAFAHSGILTGADSLVHAFADERMVRESSLNHPALRYGKGTKPRERRFFDLFARLKEQN